MIWQRIKKYFFTKKRKYKPLESYRAGHMVHSYFYHQGIIDSAERRKKVKEFVKYLLQDEALYSKFFKSLYDNDLYLSKEYLKTNSLERDYIQCNIWLTSLFADYKAHRFNQKCKTDPFLPFLRYDFFNP